MRQPCGGLPYSVGGLILDVVLIGVDRGRGIIGATVEAFGWPGVVSGGSGELSREREILATLDVKRGG